MASFGNAFSSSIGKKLIMGITGLFLISFLVVHCFINSLIIVNDGGLTFNMGAHFMGTNWIIRAMEVVLFAGLLAHIVQGFRLVFQNRAARPERYAVNNGAANSKWYSRSMGLLGTLLLIFLIVHISKFWVMSRFTGIPTVDANGNHDLFAVMVETFKNPWLVLLYVLAMVSLAYHLLHGFSSAFQTLGWNHKKYTPLIKGFGFWFSIIIPLIFALMPIVMYLGYIN
ncbi:succinate dehydrogenase cytochrome b subunit [Pedobacter panaciterrae]|jgi:succinate dehydrogenase (or fumarate reductase) cytochrome b subunit, b558 family|uniref:Succinate dehydrogenase cytochrome b subunit n=1 Tax=Pedobacter panaciterrae TaxID=363849 RepID=A0ABU8NQR5_9SPHI|nr:succinate dehydrogenase cytochrome b subunit [Pedobacter panaciterrae]NQX55015.1 succinate dehydrogenase cytochrome b subunit [Pedobacter panaciterrae]